jgi:hypothetical protein
MTTKGYKFSTDQIQGRWKSLCRAYENVKYHNNKSRNDQKHYEYENIIYYVIYSQFFGEIASINLFMVDIFSLCIFG